MQVAQSAIDDITIVGRDLSIGERSFINRGTFIDAQAPVRIGRNVAIGHNVLLLTSTHTIGPHDCRAGQQTIVAPVTIGDGTWIGAAAAVLPGVVIGAGCVIAAGAVVTSDCEPDGLYAGVPAVRKRDLSAADNDAGDLVGVAGGVLLDTLLFGPHPAPEISAIAAS